MLAAAAGIGGGAFLVGLMLLFFSFEPKQAIAMSNGLMFFCSFIVYVMSWSKSHPTLRNKVLINYNIAILMMPPMMIGNLLGSVCATFVPSLLQLIVLALIIVVSIYKTQKKARAMWAKENREKKSSKDKSEKSKN